MHRIGIAASKMAKGNRVLYNAYVALISFLFSLFVFIVAGSSVVFSLSIISYVASEIMGVDFERSRSIILIVCMVSLTVIIVLFNLVAMLKNLKISQKDR